MIQDIQPRQYNNSYKPRDPRPGDRIFFFEAKDVYLSKATGLPFTYEEVTALTSLEGKEITYLFSIDDGAFFWVHEIPEEIAQASEPVKDVTFRTLQPQWLAFACITAHHLHRWYTHNRFCGVCGHAMNPDSRERAMRCPECNNIVYPTISPAVIVGVTHGSRLLMTKYSPKNRPSATRNYALIAGFAEIGETLEECVRREVMEEVGLKVKNLRYYKSQPWSFTGCLLSGFYCDLDGGEDICLEEDELSEGSWFDRENMPEGGSAISLTHEMIENFRKGNV